MGLTASDWLTIVLFAVGGVVAAASTWFWFLLRRLLRSIDTHHLAIYGEQGLFQRLPLYVTREVHDVANAELAAQMDVLRREGQQREGRILDAIKEGTAQNTTENRILRSDLRTDLATMGSRIDRMQERRGGTR